MNIQTAMVIPAFPEAHSATVTNVALSLTVIVALFALKMVYDHQIKFAFAAASFASVLAYLLVSVLALQDALFYTQHAYGIGFGWSLLPDAAFKAPLYIALFFALCAALMQYGESYKRSSRARREAKAHRLLAKS